MSNYRRKTITAEILKIFLAALRLRHTLHTIVEYHNSNINDVLAPGRMKNCYTTAGYLKEFVQQQYKRSDVFLSELDYGFITKLEHFLRKRVPHDHHFNKNNFSIGQLIAKPFLRFWGWYINNASFFDNYCISYYLTRFIPIFQICNNYGIILIWRKDINAIKHQWLIDKIAQSRTSCRFQKFKFWYKSRWDMNNQFFRRIPILF